MCFYKSIKISNEVKIIYGFKVYLTHFDLLQEKYGLDFFRPGRPVRPKFIGRSHDGNGGAISISNDTNHHHHRLVPKPINLAGKNKPTMMAWKLITGMCQFV